VALIHDVLERHALAIPLLQSSSATQQVDDQDHDRNDQKKMDQATGDMKAETE